MPHVIVKHSAGLTFEQAAECYSDGQKHWWINHADGSQHSFVPIGHHLATYPLHLEIKLPCGRYLLGCGTGRGKLRRFFNVDLLGEVRYE